VSVAKEPTAGMAGLDAVAALAEPVRRSAYAVVAAADAPVGRDEVAAELGIGRTLAAFHLDKLVAAGLLEVSFAHRTGRGGPGAGRPAKLYHRSRVEVDVTVPPRTYPRAALLLAETLERIGADAALFEAARRHGLAAGANLGRPRTQSVRQVVDTLAERGYEPTRHGDLVRLRNCPFQTVAEQFPPLVCGMNLALIDGLVDGAGWRNWTARLEPAAEGCCVVLARVSKNNSG
jgi:predicted ArsR family transcriptional regulator